MPAQPRPQPGKIHTTAGPISGVPCPHGCGHKNDFRPLAGQSLGGMGEGEIGLETGAVFSCDRCKQRFKIAAIEQLTVIRVAPLVPRR